MLLKFALRHEFWDLLTYAWRLVGSDPQHALADPQRVIESLPRCLLKFLFESSHSNATEADLLRILLESDSESQKELADLIKLPLITPKDMMQLVVPSGFFDLTRCVAAMAYQSDPSSVVLPVQSTKCRQFVWHRMSYTGSSPGRRSSRSFDREESFESSLSLNHENRGTAEGWCLALALYFPITEEQIKSPIQRKSDEDVQLEQKDIRLVVSQANCTWEAAEQVLRRHRNDIVAAIIDLSSGGPFPD